MYACNKRGCAFQTHDLRELIRHAELQHQSANPCPDQPSGLRLTPAGWLASFGSRKDDDKDGRRGGR